MSEHVFFITIFLLFGTVLTIFGMKYVSAAYQARARVLAEGAYRDLAEKASAAQTQTAAALAKLQSDLSEVGARLIAVEKILKEVG